MPRPAPSLKAKALSCIAQREHSRVELKRKLVSHAARQARVAAEALVPGQDAARSADEPDSLSDTPDRRARAQAHEVEVDALLDWLVTKDLLNPERFVDTRVQARSARFGNLRIRQELAQHGHTLDETTAQALKQSERARAQTLWARRFGMAASDAAGRAKQARFLLARGFSGDVVRRVVAGSAED